MTIGSIEIVNSLFTDTNLEIFQVLHRDKGLTTTVTCSSVTLTSPVALKPTNGNDNGLITKQHWCSHASCSLRPVPIIHFMWEENQRSISVNRYHWISSKQMVFHHQELWWTALNEADVSSWNDIMVRIP